MNLCRENCPILQEITNKHIQGKEPIRRFVQYSDGDLFTRVLVSRIMQKK